MTAEEAIKNLILDIAAVSTLISTRVYPEGAVPQGPTKPFATHTVVDRKQDGDMGGDSDICREVVTLTFFSDTRKEAKALADLCSQKAPNGISNYQGTVTSGGDTLDVMGIFLEKSKGEFINLDDGSNNQLFSESTDYEVVYER